MTGRGTRGRPIGTITRGTTNPNRLRRLDRWLAGPARQALRTPQPIIVDLGFGATPITTLELAARLLPGHPDLHVLGLEIDPARVATALDQLPLLRERFGEQVITRTSFALGGFEVPAPGGAPVAVIRAANVLRQYDEQDVPAAWQRLRSRVTPNGLVVDATCDEIGRLAAWIALDVNGPVSLTLSFGLRWLGTPSDVAPRLPKALIHHNIPGRPVHAYLNALNRAWATAAALSTYGPRQRFLATARAVRDAGWPLLDGPDRWRLGEITVAWDAVAPTGPAG